MCHVVGLKLLFLSLLKPAAYVLWVLMTITVPSVYLYWAVLLIKGPGFLPLPINLPVASPLDVLDPLGRSPLSVVAPLAFLCDALGFPIYCSHCQQLKPERAFHLSQTNRCVPRFDHYCLWIGSVVGRDNLVPFYKFLQFSALYSAICIVYVAITIRHAQGNGKLLPHILVALVFNVFFAMFLFGMLITTLNQICHGATTLDMYTMKDARIQKRWDNRNLSANPKFFTLMLPPPRRFESGIRYVNIQHENTRLVVSYDVSQYPYSLGARQNLIDAFVYRNRVREGFPRGSLLDALVIIIFPYFDLFVGPSPDPADQNRYESWSDEFGTLFLALIREKISLGQYLKPSFANVQDLPLENAKDITE